MLRSEICSGPIIDTVSVLATDFDLKVLALKYEKKIVTSQFITFKQNRKKKNSNFFSRKKNYILGGIWVHLVRRIQWDLGAPP